MGNSFRYACAGIRNTWRTEASFRRVAQAGVVLVPTAFAVATSWLECAGLLYCWGQVLMAELLNTAIEAAVDRIGAEHHELSGIAKDAGGGAVLLSMGFGVMVWCVAIFD